MALSCFLFISAFKETMIGGQPSIVPTLNGYDVIGRVGTVFDDIPVLIRFIVFVMIIDNILKLDWLEKNIGMIFMR